MIILNKRKDKYLNKIIYLSLLLVAVNLSACSNQTQEEKIAAFNKRYVPEYQLSSTYLRVNWRADKQQSFAIAPLKLNIPIAYLYQVVSDKGEIRTYQLEFKNGRLSPIWIGLRHSDGQPAIAQDYSTGLFDSEKVKANKIKVFKDYYIFQISYFPPRNQVNKKESYNWEVPIKQLFRNKDIAGLEHYGSLNCYSAEELEKYKIRDDDYSRMLLNRLNNKDSNDITPKNCELDQRVQFWISPQGIPVEQAVGIQCSNFEKCEIHFNYRGHMINIVTGKSPNEMIPYWKVYQQQVTQVLDSFLID